MAKTKTSKIRKSARGEECQIRIPGVCNFDNATTVLAHINGGGMGYKRSDNESAYTCSSCHDVVDGRVVSEYPYLQIIVWFYEGVMRTQKILIEKGLMTVEGLNLKRSA